MTVAQQMPDFMGSHAGQSVREQVRTPGVLSEPIRKHPGVIDTLAISHVHLLGEAEE
jgi:hypothetical protein